MAEPGAALTPEQHFILLWELDSGEEMLWHLRELRVFVSDAGEARTVGPGVLMPDSQQRFRAAQRALFSLLERGFVRVRKVGEPYGDGEVLSVAEARQALKSGNNWLPPTDRQRSSYYCVELTSDGDRQLDLASPEDFPSLPGRVP